MSRNYEPKTIKKLYANSGNQCAMYGCTQQLFPIGLGHNSSEIAHIEGVEPGSARHNPNLTKEEINAYDNLILLCPNHHTQIDAKENISIYTVNYLKKMKCKHEQDVYNKFLRNMEPPKSIEEINTDRLIEMYINKASVLFEEVSEQEIYSAVNRIINQSRETRYILFLIIINSKIKQNDINMFCAINSISISEEEKARQLMVLENLEFVKEYYFTGEGIDKWFENADLSLTNYSENYFVKLNQGKWGFTKYGKIIYCVYLVLNRSNLTFFHFLVNGDVGIINQ